MTAEADPQRLVLVLPTTAEFDSRTYRIASAAVRRGHQVTVLARSGPDLPTDEEHPAGYRIIRVSARAIDGLPRPLQRLFGTPVPTTSAQGTASAPAPAPAPAPTPTRAVADGGSSAPASRFIRRMLRVIASGPRAVARAALRRLAIPLVIRAQRNASRAVAPSADLYHGMAYMGIPVALDLAGRSGGRVVYDARDIYVDAANLARLPRWMRWLVGRAERGWARRADRVVTVNRPYAEVMAHRWRIDEPLIVMNCSYRFDPPASPDRLIHAALGLDPGTRVVLYQGGFSRDRGIEQLIEAIPDVPNAMLVLLGYGVLEPELRRIAADPLHAGKVAVLPAVPPDELIGWVASADVVAMPIQPSTLNHRLTTPNKLFEALTAGVPMIASDLPGMAPIVRESGAGRLVDPTDPRAIAEALRSILDAPRGASGSARSGGRRGPGDLQLGDAGRPPVRGVRQADRQAVVSQPVGSPAPVPGSSPAPGTGPSASPAPRTGPSRAAPAPDDRPRAVLLVANVANPYSRALRVARSLDAAGFAVEIAAVTGDAPVSEMDGRIRIRRYEPSGRWAGAADPSGETRGLVGRVIGRAHRTLAAVIRPLKRYPPPTLDTLRKVLLWPFPVRGWWATLRRDLPPADLYHAFGILTVGVALDLAADARRAGRQGSRRLRRHRRHPRLEQLRDRAGPDPALVQASRTWLGAPVRCRGHGQRPHRRPPRDVVAGPRTPDGPAQRPAALDAPDGSTGPHPRSDRHPARTEGRHVPGPPRPGARDPRGRRGGASRR